MAKRPAYLGVTITQGTFPLTFDSIDHNDTPTWNVVDQAYELLCYCDADLRRRGGAPRSPSPSSRSIFVVTMNDDARPSTARRRTRLGDRVV